MAKQQNFNINDKLVINEFKKIQQQNLEDIRAMTQGKEPKSEKEITKERQARVEKEA